MAPGAPTLTDSGLPMFCRLTDGLGLGLEPPEPRRGLSVRTLVRALDGMQKEGLVTSSAGGEVWRLSCDEGPYLAGTDLAPPPLGFLSVGMAAAYANEILALARDRGVSLEGFRLTQDNYYTMQGSALGGTMTGGALPPDLLVEANGSVERDELRSIVLDGVAASPLNGLMRGESHSLFSLMVNGEQVEVGRVGTVPGKPLPDPGSALDGIASERDHGGEDLMAKVREAEQVEGEGGVESSLKAEQSRKLHARAVCTVRDDGVKVLDQYLFQPIGSQFRFLSDEAPGLGGEGRAPDAATYISAGFGFCFMTQVGRYAKITKQRLDHYRIVQDSHFSPGGASGETGRPGEADPLETHVHLGTPEGVEAARRMVDMGEQTCFLHAFCRTDLEANVRVALAGEEPVAVGAEARR